MTRITSYAALCICITAIPLHAQVFSVTSPNGGEVWEAGTTHEITWQIDGSSCIANVFLYKGGTLVEQLNSTCYDFSPFSWTICEDYEPGDDYFIKVVANDDYPDLQDFSDAPFEITSDPLPTLDLTSPDGGGIWMAGTPQTITWDSSNARGLVDVDLYDNGQFQRRLGRVPMADGQFTWDVCHWLTNSSDYTVRIRWIPKCGTAVVEDESIWPFAILNATPLPTLTLTHPSGGETFYTDSVQTITWDSANTLGNVELWLTDSMATTNGHYFEYLGSAPMTDGQFDWVLPPCLGNGVDYSVLLHWEDCGAIVEDANTIGFEVAGSHTPTIEVTGPAQGEVWTTGTTVQTSWTTITTNGEVEVQLVRDSDGVFVTSLGRAPVAAGTFSCTLYEGVPAGDYRVRHFMPECTTLAESERIEVLNANAPVLILTSPVGGDSWEAGTTQNITWIGTNLNGYVDLYLPHELPNCWGRVSVPASDQSYAWKIPPTLTADSYYRVTINAFDRGEVARYESPNFAVTPPTTPAGDFDDDGDVDLQDVAIFQACHTGRGPTLFNIPCDTFDFEPDADIDVDDFQTMLNQLTGPASQEE